MGQKVRATGYRGDYQGDVQLGQVISAEVIDETINTIAPSELSLAQAGDYEANGGKLAQVSGTVKSVDSTDSGAISSVILTNGTRDFRLLFNNYIGYSDETSTDITTFVKEGAQISAVGVIYMEPDGVCLRVRDLSEVKNESSSPVTPPPSGSIGYSVAIGAMENGSVTSSLAWASEGAAVTLTVRPNSGYELGSITVTGPNGGNISLTRAGDNSYTFTMPAGNVTVEATFLEEGAETLPYEDVDSDDWFYEAVAYAHENGLMNGVGGRMFDPNGTLTRGMMVTILYRLEGQPESETHMPFGDVETDAWYAQAVSWAAGQGIVLGTGGDSFEPGAMITREQLATMRYRYAVYKAYDTAQDGDAIRQFDDFQEVSGWALEGLEWAVNAQLVNGKENNMLDPAGSATRAEAATLLMRFIQAFNA